MKDGAVLAQWPPCQIIDADIVTAPFGLPCVVVPNSVSGTPMVVARGRRGPPARMVARGAG